MENLDKLVNELRKLPNETQWLEFKHNNNEPDMIGQNISALANISLRERFGLKDSAAGTVSRLIKEAVASEFIKPLDPTTAPRYMKYIPIWA